MNPSIEPTQKDEKGNKSKYAATDATQLQSCMVAIDNPCHLHVQERLKVKMRPKPSPIAENISERKLSPSAGDRGTFTCRTLPTLLLEFDEDNLIPCYGFGDATTHDQHFFSFYPEDRSCNGFEDVMGRFREIVPQLTHGSATKSHVPNIIRRMKSSIGCSKDQGMMTNF
ncbi:E3 ubiquitin-protein ligase RGLG5 [Artemisia annua]|uniref:E3 ubiquitin-protein ligase RGLG5 n=1 Tax=Artemisia annua TaxID=35608 RepID=A0A2U1MS04_ARTAN|nr:E3 ubiquitin-protein ligase RGLG5 [Artemisia annua]